MSELDFDSCDWPDYVPVGNDEVVRQKEMNNPNLIKLSINDNCELFEIDSYEEFFDNLSETDYDDNEFVRFIKDIDRDGVSIFHCSKDEDFFLLVKDGKKYLLNVYQSNEYYFDDNKLTFTGWDYNIVIDTEKMTSKTKHIR